MLPHLSLKTFPINAYSCNVHCNFSWVITLLLDVSTFSKYFTVLRCTKWLGYCRGFLCGVFTGVWGGVGENLVHEPKMCYLFGFLDYFSLQFVFADRAEINDDPEKKF